MFVEQDSIAEKPVFTVEGPDHPRIPHPPAPSTNFTDMTAMWLWHRLRQAQLLHLSLPLRPSPNLPIASTRLICFSLTFPIRTPRVNRQWRGIRWWAESMLDHGVWAPELRIDESCLARSVPSPLDRNNKSLFKQHFSSTCWDRNTHATSHALVRAVSTNTRCRF